MAAGLACATFGPPPTPTPAGQKLDWGDAPDPSYPTLTISDGARHVVGALFLGSTVDTEVDGQPNDAALGDDTAGTDDEDGVVFTAPGRVTVTASAPGLLNAWADFNGDGTWSSGEQIFRDQALAAGPNDLNFRIPTFVAPEVYFRFRFDSGGGLSPSGFAPDGEVEDYVQKVEGGPPWTPTPTWPRPTPTKTPKPTERTITSEAPTLTFTPTPTPTSTPTPTEFKCPDGFSWDNLRSECSPNTHPDELEVNAWPIPVQSGEKLTISGSGFTPNGKIRKEFSCYNGLVVWGWEMTADANGSFTASLDTTNLTPPADCTLTVTDVTTGAVGVLKFEVR